MLPAITYVNCNCACSKVVASNVESLSYQLRCRPFRCELFNLIPVKCWNKLFGIVYGTVCTRVVHIACDRWMLFYSVFWEICLLAEVISSSTMSFFCRTPHSLFIGRSSGRVVLPEHWSISATYASRLVCFWASRCTDAILIRKQQSNKTCREYCAAEFKILKSVLRDDIFSNGIESSLEFWALRLVVMKGL